MGYKDRLRYLDEQHRDLIFDRSGNGTSVILVAGRVVGVWDAEDGPEPMVKLLLFHPVNQDVADKLHPQDGSHPADAIHAHARALGRFIFDREACIRWRSLMVPLTERTAGSMMSPLKGCPLENADS